MGEGNHLSATGKNSQSRGRFVWLFGGTLVAVAAAGMMMQYVRSASTKAASDPPATGATRVTIPSQKPQVLAKVGQEVITYDIVAEESVKRHGREVLDDLIHRLIIQQACEKNNITVSEKEISDEIARIAKRFNLDVNQWLQMLQVERNISPVQYRQSVIFPMIALKKLAGEDVEVTETEMKQAFVRNYGPRVKARMIMFDNQRRAQECWDKLSNDPDSFEALARERSIDPNSKALGGQIPPIPRFNGSETVEKEAFRLKNGDISGVIEVDLSRYIILKCEGRTEPVVHNIDDVRNTLYDEIKESKIQAAVAKKFEDIKSATVVDNFLTGTTNRPERAAGGQSTIGGPDASGSDVQPTSGTKSRPNSNATRTSNSSNSNGSTKPSRD